MPVCQQLEYIADGLVRCQTLRMSVFKRQALVLIRCGPRQQNVTVEVMSPVKEISWSC